MRKPSVVSHLEKGAVSVWLESDPRNSLRVIEALSHEVQELRSRLALVRIRSAKERLLTYFSLLARDGKVELNRPLTQVASEISLTHESVYRALAALEREGRLERFPGGVRLLRPVT